MYKKICLFGQKVQNLPVSLPWPQSGTLKKYSSEANSVFFKRCICQKEKSMITLSEAIPVLTPIYFRLISTSDLRHHTPNLIHVGRKKQFLHNITSTLRMSPESRHLLIKNANEIKLNSNSK